ncbi:ABC transporter permease [Cellulomonas fimi]|uniref:FtsX-like permease family protein n=1 Tax=Cellulomonas fimi TaxID=1708 RepID=A0A7Y0LZK9_CELFI|nr:ABC transporter permease [Cellulomonas fimi]NMR20841.1 FtsX-like permease family protein [Cellulomonas fimi]
MLRLTLAQMRRSLGRLTAAGIAIAIGTAFVAATLIAGGVITRTTYDAVSASYADADLVVTAPSDEELTADQLDTLRRTPGVAAVDGRLVQWVEVSKGPRRAYHEVTVVASHPRLDAQTVAEGSFPARTGEIALPGPVAERLGVGVGDPVTTSRSVWGAGAEGADGTDGRWVEESEELTVVGITDDPAGAFAQSGGAVVVTRADAERWDAASRTDPSAEATYGRAVVALDPGVSLTAGKDAVTAAAPDRSTVRTKDEQAEAITAELTGGADVFTTIVLGFAAVALLVAALVIANTFQVLIAQRTRTLALLRCVGADKKQLRRSVLVEAALLGLGGSFVGLVVGVGLAQVALSVLGASNLDVPLPAAVPISPAVVIAPLVVGTLMTVLACFAPARAATRVSPLAALRPADAPAVTQRRNLPRLVLATLLTVGGIALLLLAVAVGRRIDEVAALGIGVLGGALSFVGVLVGAVFWVPRVVAAVGRLLAGTGTAARLAAANSVRNPRRTAATSTALLIGVTLVTMMSTGAASARVTLGQELDTEFPVDVVIATPGGSADAEAAGLAVPALVREVEDVAGVAQVVALRRLDVRVELATGDEAFSTAQAVGAAEAAALLRAPSMVADLDDTTVVVSSQLAEALGLVGGETVTVEPDASGAQGAVGGTGTVGAATAATPLGLTVVVSDLPDGVLVTPAVLDRMGVEVPANEVWARLTDVTDAAVVVPAIQDALSDTAVQIGGGGVERARYQQVIDTLLAVVVGLLAVAVVIALIGVANTLSLSVLERRRESATLRALGLSRRQLRGTLAIEGMLIAGVGGVLGATLGTLYGWAGAATVLGVVGDVRLEVPWRDLGLVVAVAVVAGLLASILPGRAAARTSPVAALAVE